MLRLVSNAFYAASAYTFAWLATRGEPISELKLVALAVFVVAAIVAIVQLRQANATAPVIQGGAIAGATFLIVGIVMFVVYWTTKVDALPIYAGVTFYLGAGWLVLAWRESDYLRPWRAVVVLGVGTGALIVTLLVLPEASRALVYAGLAIAATLLPVGLNLASRDAELVLKTPWAKKRRHVLAAIGLLATIAVTGMVGLFSHDWNATWPAVVAAIVVVFSITTQTHLDTALALLAFIFVTAAPPEDSSDQVPKVGVGERALVALGDSYMSGEGAARFFAGTDDAGGNECRRAPSAYAEQVGTDKNYFDGLTFLACSGATVQNVLATPPNSAHVHEQYKNIGTQLDTLTDLIHHNSGFHPAMVIISLGGNDAGFARIGEACLAPGECSDSFVESIFTDRLTAVASNVRAAYGQLRALLPETPIVGIPYPMPIIDKAACTDIALTKSERDFVRSFLEELNKRVVKAAVDATSNAFYAEDMQRSIVEHHLALCDPKNRHHPGINAIKLAGVHGLKGSGRLRFVPSRLIHDCLHPNAAGHDAMADTFRTWLKQHLSLITHSSSASGTINATTDPLDTRHDDFAKLSYWERSRVRDLTWAILIILTGIAGLWLAMRAPF